MAVVLLIRSEESTQIWIMEPELNFDHISKPFSKRKSVGNYCLAFHPHKEGDVISIFPEDVLCFSLGWLFDINFTGIYVFVLLFLEKMLFNLIGKLLNSCSLLNWIRL